MSKTDNLVPHMGKLTDKQLAFLLRVVKLHAELPREVHAGVLPFLKKEIAVQALQKHLSLQADSENVKSAEKRYCREILNRLGVTTESLVSTFKFFLNDTKVYNMSRQDRNSNHIIRLPFYIKREVGLQWQEFGKKWVSPEENKVQEISLKRIKMGLWEVTCPTLHVDAVKELLLERYGS